jgi:hypothetical protein
MKKTNTILAVVGAGAMMALPAGAQGISLNFSSTPGATIQFNGASNSFQFNASTSTLFGGVFAGSQWLIGSESNGNGSGVGLLGAVNGGPFTYGPITTSGTEQSAAVTGPLGALVISSASGNLTGEVNWAEIETFNFSGALNASLVVNVTDLAYTGSNADLQKLASEGLGSMNLSFQFSPGETLSQLSTGNTPFTTSYSGSISASPVPEPASYVSFLIGACVLGSARFLKRK